MRPYLYRSTVDLLERDEGLTALQGAHARAARGYGGVVLVTGEPGIGKTSLVERFADGLADGTRILTGTCDDLTIARPLAPFSDLLGFVSTSLEAAIAAGAPPQELHPLLLAELDVRSRTTVLVLEDVHWADEATLDAITFLARRIASLPALLVLTCRTGEAAPDHPLHAALAAIPASQATFLELAPLSAVAVAQLAGPRSERIHAATGGNPFYVTELLAYSDADGVPPSVVTAVAGRASRLEADARRLVDLVAVVPRRVSTTVLDRAFPGWADAAVEPERRHLLEVGPRHVRFRHELVRHAIHEAIPSATRRAIHGEILDVMLEAGADAADIVHHAERAGADDVVAEHALVAARRAAATGANREAYAHFHRSLDFLDRYPPREQAVVLEELVDVAHLIGRFADAIAAIERAIAIWRALGDDLSVGRCTRSLSRLLWFVGDGPGSRAEADEALAILEPLGDSMELATVYSVRARLAMLAADGAAAREWARRALELAEKLGDECTRVNALVTLATVEVDATASSAAAVEAYDVAREAGFHYESLIAVGNLGHSLLWWGLPREATQFVEQAMAEAEERELHHLVSYTQTTKAWLRLRAGEWDAAERIAGRAARTNRSVTALLAETVLAELAVRRGDADATARLESLYERATRTSDVARVMPVLDLMVEQSLTGDAPAPLDRLRDVLMRPDVEGQFVVRIGAAAALAGLEVDVDGPPRSPYCSVAAGDWRAAADAFGEVGWPYDRALMLSLLDDAGALTEALATARALGAEPLIRRVARRMRALGLRVPRGPYSAARSNAAGLTARQLEVLGLVARGCTNAEIADELVVSLRTVEHHVAAVLLKLGATSRRDAARRADELALIALAR